MQITNDWVAQMNFLGSQKQPFIFILDFELKKPLLFTIDKLPHNIYYKFENISNFDYKPKNYPSIQLQTYPVSLDVFSDSYAQVVEQILKGNSFLLNLTFATEITLNQSFQSIFAQAKAKYKLLIDNQLVCFSPETFVKIKDGIIYTYPMKGTIDASLPDAKETLLLDQKEIAEHYTIVDLLRNDLSMVAKNVQVNAFRYFDTIETNHKKLLQTSSEIQGKLTGDYINNLGTIFHTLLPAGSISGAPKKKTCEIIQSVEKQERGYYTGVCGYFDGHNVDSFVMIRYIESLGGKSYYRSGCGITSQSNVDAEYQELLDKIYVPTN